jgi:hypothetical protein
MTDSAAPDDAPDPADVAALADDALGDLTQHLLDTAARLEALAGRARALQDHRRSGVPWHELVLTEDRPLIVEQLAAVLDDLGGSSGRFRRAEALALSAHGLSHRSIATLFGVTRQRVGALLAPSPGASGDQPLAR